ncbi:MAG: nitrous oxide reductase accessory protein NosL [Polaromonas sp.]|nr:nitrous oxide reductase accessory protein NosL [Polaromonas sp.]
MKTIHAQTLRGSVAAFTIAMALAGAGPLAGCSKSEPVAVTPIEITRGTICSLDGMTLMDFPGPKAQMQYEHGNPDFFCDTVEMFSIYLRPEQQQRVRAIFVQDMAKADWDNPTGHWINAKTAFYVAGSKRLGSMGPTLGSFSSEADASAFAAREGGKVYRFDQITPDMVVLDGGVLKDHKM